MESLQRAKVRGKSQELGLLHCHFLDHGQAQLAITVIQAARVAADLAQEAEIVVRELGQGLRPVAVARLGEEMGKRALHGSGDFRQSVKRWDGVSIFYAGEIAAQQAGALFNVALRHPSL